jgi:hypothetical protein
MKEISWVSENGNPEIGELLSLLRGHVFHITTQSAHRSIVKTGAALHNRDEIFRLNTHSQNSFGRQMGYVCLFDLRVENEARILDFLGCYYFLKPTWFAERTSKSSIWDMAYLILNPRYYEKIIPNAQWRSYLKTDNPYLDAIPYGEVWIENQLPLEWVQTLIRVRIVEPPDSLEWLVQGSHELQRGVPK